MKKVFPINLEQRHRTVIGLIKDNKFRLFLAVICMLLIAGTTAALAYLVKPVC